MTAPRRTAVAVVFALAVGVGTASCGDDGNDRAFQAQRAADPVAADRGQTTTTDARSASVADDSASASTRPTRSTPPTATTQVVALTGVVVPVVALDNSFRPSTIEISVGDEVLWENRGKNEHNVLQVEGGHLAVEVGDFQPGAVYSHVFMVPGEYRYYCSIHGNESVGMVGTVVVTG